MERNWQYLQEKINLVQGINDEIKEKSKNQNQIKDPYSITPPGVTIPTPVQLSSNQMLPIQMIPIAEQPYHPQAIKVYDNTSDTGICTGDSCPIQIRPKILWIDGNNQVSQLTNN